MAETERNTANYVNILADCITVFLRFVMQIMHASVYTQIQPTTNRKTICFICIVCIRTAYYYIVLMRLSLIIILHESNRARNKDVLNKKEQI